MDTTHVRYLHDLAQRFMLDAIEAKATYQDCLKSKGIGTAECEFKSGMAQAYYEVLSTVINLAYSFDLDLAVLGLEGVDPDKLLLSRNTNEQQGQ